jgi:polyisoprenoid-binding protein YceI
MKKTWIAYIGIILVISLLSAQEGVEKYFTKNGKVTFFSDAPMEKIEAKNNKVNAAIDTKSGAVFFKVLIKSFVFEKALMQEHFNENYLESDKYPSSTFKGKIVNLSEVKFDSVGKYTVQIQGKLTIHGITKDIKTVGEIIVKKEGIQALADFNVKLKDYKIRIPGAVTGKIAETVKVSVDADMKALKK